MGWRLLGAVVVVPEVLFIAMAVSSQRRLIWIVLAILYVPVLLFAFDKWVGREDDPASK